MEVVVIGLIALAFPVCAIAGFVLALNLRERADVLERRVGALEAEIVVLRAGPAAASTADEPETEPEPEPAPVFLPEEAAVAPPEPPPFPVAPPPAPRPGLEESLGARWTVWVGGVALALGGVFLVRYSIEQGLLGPGARTLAGAFFALLLLAAGEGMRRRDDAAAISGIPSAHVPAVLTGAGVTSAFATAYAAHALYDLIGPGLAFGLLGAIAVLAMLAATLHGPGLAALGLLGALASPLLVQSDAPRLWPLVVYLAFVTLAAYGVARLRLWAWLAGAAAAGAFAWGLALLGMGARDAGPAMAHALAQTALACLAFLALPYRGVPDREAPPDRLAGVALGAFAVLAVLVAADLGDGRVPFAGATTALLLAAALRFPAGAPAAAHAALVGAGTLALWPVAAQIAQAPVRRLPQVMGSDPQPEAVTAFLGFALAAGLAVAAGGVWRIARGRTLPTATAAWFAGAATLGPLAILVVAWARVSDLGTSLPFALAAGGVALGFTAAAAWLRRLEDDAAAGIRLAVGATASAAVAALALGLTFALDRGMLTVALALAALGTAWVADRARLPALRWAVGAAGVVVAGRLAWDPTIAGADLGRTPILNWLLWGYGVPALAFLIAGRILERGGRDWVARLAESLALVFAALLAFMQVRHLTTGGDLARPAVGFVELGLYVVTSLAFAWLLVRVEAARPDPVSRIGGLVAGALGLGIAAVGLGVTYNPLLTSEPVLGGPALNTLLAAYLLPALLAGVLARAARGSRPDWYVGGAAALALGLLVAYAILAVRRAFQGPLVGILRETSQGEMWAHSVALLAIGAGLLGLGLWRGVREARLASGVVIAAVVVKVFVVDLAHLEGALRAFSFIGLGLALVAIGRVYQRLLGRPAVGAAPH